MSLRIPFVLIVILMSGQVFSQSAPGTEKSPVEIKDEPRHHLKFENRLVRVWDALIPAGGATLWHIHSNDNVVITLNDAHVRVETVGGAPAEMQAKFGDVGFRKAPYVHRTMSIGSGPFHNMAIELLPFPDRSERPVMIADKPGWTPVVENERVVVYKISLAAAESTGMKPFAQGLEVMLTSSEIEISNKDAGKVERKKVNAGDVIWRANPGMQSIKNVGTAPLLAVDVELK